jgi:hypothetical protein
MRKGQGLGKNSPISLSLGKENYEALIERHGQWVRWLQAFRCSCTTANNRPDIHCALCGGEGYQYRFQRTIEEVLSLFVQDGTLIELPVKHVGIIINDIRDYMGIQYTEDGRFGRYVRISGPRRPAKGERLDLSVTRPIVKTLESDRAFYKGAGNFLIGGLALTGVPGVANNRVTSADIISIGSLDNETIGVNYPVMTSKRAMAFAEAMAEPEDTDVVIAKKIEYIEPFFFIVTGQQTHEADVKFLESIQGDASMSFPECYKVGEGDIVTLLAANQVGKRTIVRGAGDIDTLPEFYIEEIKEIEDAGNKYLLGTDFTLWGTNKIRWLGDNRPIAGANYFVFYDYNPTYRVIRDYPNVRSSENQNLPRRVALKLLSTFADRKLI